MKALRTKHMKTVLLAGLLLAALVLSTACGVPTPEGDPPENGPIIFYQGNTVALPGDIVTVSGEYLDTITSVQVEGQEVPMIQANKQSFKFEIPKNLKEGAFTCYLIGPGVVETVVINKPVSRWVQGDEGSIATPGGWLRVNGECLSVADKKASVELVDENGKKKTLSAAALDAYSAEVEIPEDLPKGTYTARYSNGCAWSEEFQVTVGTSPRDSWPTDVFNILDYGAKPNVYDYDNAAAVNAALWDIRDNGGGILYFPKGFYHMVGAEFSLPENTVIRGEDKDLVRIYWGRLIYDEPMVTYEWDLEEMPQYLFGAVAGNIAFEDITVAGGLLPTFLQTSPLPGPEPAAKNIYIQRCRIWANATGSKFPMPEKDAEIYGNMSAPMISTRCDNLQITDCELQWNKDVLASSNHSFAFAEVKNSLIRNNSILRVYTYSYNYTQSTGLSAVTNGAIMENNDIEGFTTNILGDNCYFAGNRMSNKLDGDREAMTSDYCNGIEYYGPITFEDETHVVFPAEAGVGELVSDNERYGPLYAVFILDGTGAGQYRYVTVRDGSRLTLESPFTVWDETSLFSFARMGTNWYVVRNRVDNSGSTGLYCPQSNTVFADNDIYFSEGLDSEGFAVYGAYSFKWYISFEGNRMYEGVYYGSAGAFGPNDIYQTRMRLAALTEVRISISSLVRRNEFYDISNLRLYHIGPVTNGSDLVIEDNYFRDALVGINFYGSCYNGTVLAGNRFENCDENIAYPAETECYIEID